jgi:hypothetical protein
VNRGLKAGYHPAEVTVLATKGHAATKTRPAQRTLGLFFVF